MGDGPLDCCCDQQAKDNVFWPALGKVLPEIAQVSNPGVGDAVLLSQTQATEDLRRGKAYLKPRPRAAKGENRLLKAASWPGARRLALSRS